VFDSQTVGAGVPRCTTCNSVSVFGSQTVGGRESIDKLKIRLVVVYARCLSGGCKGGMSPLLCLHRF